MEGKESGIERAIEQTKKAEEAMKEIENILKYRLNIDDKDVWDVLKDKSRFPEPKPQPPQFLPKPQPPQPVPRP
ncbi:MAG TPA: hypothetical protein ACFYD6_11095 [Candidatus Brocadiia bacterium]|nr:hypothetical protein [Candidatus Brocadiales bacterium]